MICYCKVLIKSKKLIYSRTSTRKNTNMALSPLEYDLLRTLYGRADKAQKAKFVDWMTALPPNKKPPPVKSVEEYLCDRAVIPSCPACGGTHLVKNGTHQGRQRFLCKDCKKTVGLSRSSIYFASKKPYLTWKTFEKCMAGRMSLRKCARVCNISLPTASAWRHKYQDRMLEMLKESLHNMATSGNMREDVDWDELGKSLATQVAKAVRGKMQKQPF